MALLKKVLGHIGRTLRPWSQAPLGDPLFRHLQGAPTNDRGWQPFSTRPQILCDNALATHIHVSPRCLGFQAVVASPSRLPCTPLQTLGTIAAPESLAFDTPIRKLRPSCRDMLSMFFI